MRYLEVGGARLSVVGLGTAQVSQWGYGDTYATETLGRLIRKALDLGINVIDTAEMYGFGRAERSVGEALDGHREDAFLATKLAPVLPLGPIVRRRAAASARRLRTDRLDLYMLHWPNPLVPLRHTMAALRDLQRQCLVRHLGVSNYSLERWRAAEAALGGPVLSNEVRFSLVHRKPQKELVPYASREGRVVIAWSPLAQGLFSGRYDARHRPSGVVRRFNPLFAPDRAERLKDLIAVLTAVGRPSGATSTQVALAWVLHRPNVVAIPGASSEEQVTQNAGAADLELSEEDDQRLQAAADRFLAPG